MKEATTPRVSIIVPLHNKGAYVAETIESVLAQTMPDWEMIVVENYSTDEGPVIAGRFAQKDPRVRFFEAPPSVRGPGAARNFGLTQAKGEWVLFLDADDLILPDHLERLLVCDASKGSASIIAGSWKEMIGAQISEVWHRPANFGAGKARLLAGAVALTPWIVHAAVIRRALLLDDCFWPEELDGCPDEDTAFWFKAIAKGEVAWAESCGAVYRKGLASSRSASEDLVGRLGGYREIVRHNLLTAISLGVVLDPAHAKHLSTMFEVAYRNALRSGNSTVADTALREAEAWLAKAPIDSWHVGVRKCLGIPLTNKIKNFVAGIT